MLVRQQQFVDQRKENRYEHQSKVIIENLDAGPALSGTMENYSRGGLYFESDRCCYYVYRATWILFKWLNRKSQRKAYTWEGFTQALNWVGWPKPSIRRDLNPFRRAETC